jgi:hypothetical protein
VSDLDNNGWGEYRKLIVAELARLSAGVAKLDEKLNGIDAAIRALELRRTDARWLVGTVIAMGAVVIALFALLRH